MNCHAWIVMQNINVIINVILQKNIHKNIRQKYTSVLPRAVLVVQSGALM
jgi:hypothetical protein